MASGNASATMHSWSFWAMPKGALAAELQGEIDCLAARFSDAPRFPPHVTLVGAVEMTEERVLAAARALAARLEPYWISFDRVSCGSIFHQCVYVLASNDPATMQAGAAAREVCGLDPGASYMPHLSLLYSDINGEQRQAVAAEAQARLLEGPGALLGRGQRWFQVESVAVWRTAPADKSLASWELVADVPLAGGGAAP